jgi:hypothetical protein
LQLELGDFDERLRRDLDERRLRREQLAARAEATAAREQEFERRNASGKSKKQFTPSAPFQERLRQDLEKRRARGTS